MLAVVVSRSDSASEHVGEQLLDLVEWTETVDEERPDGDGGGTVYRRDGVELRTFDAIHLDLESVATAFDDSDLLVFASRHAGETGPLLTAHHTGNFGPAEFGGADGVLARACPNAHRRVVEALESFAPEGYEVGMEATHHGPSVVGAPSMFVEVGSDEPQWDDADAARAVARAILALEDTEPDTPRENGTRRHLVGFGGGHYAPRFERVLRETDWAIGHVGADWALDAMGDPRDNRAVIERAFEESRADYALLEAERPALRETIEDLGYRVVDETWVRETSGVSLGLVDRLEAAIGPIDDGLRCGEPARTHDADFVVWNLSGELLARASGIDRERTRAVVAETALAFDTEQNGTEVVGPVALPAPDDREPIVEGLTAVLAQSYDEVVRDGDCLRARETAFDPSLARECGVPEGPKFGQLSAGHSVEVDGETVDPADVVRERVDEFELPEVRSA
ncbi:D-aminoacyl-tRNA deacylase [Halomicrobium sp. HM KBTZ05]|uniref:D-aminoacyl-tRNA deacylase n=1 Tax=Halomicrobium sp. HM KBTZ05 TaxID=3242663 RepID=UPI003555F4C1